MKNKVFKICIIFIVIVIILLVKKYNFEKLATGEYVYYDPIKDQKCDKAHYWTTYNKNTTCYRWIVLESKIKAKLMLDHNYVFKDKSEYINYDEIDNSIKKINREWKINNIQSISLKDALKYFDIGFNTGIKKLDSREKIKSNKVSLLGFGNFSYDEINDKMIYHNGIWLSNIGKNKYIINSNGAVEKVDSSIEKIGFRPVITLSKRKCGRDEKTKDIESGKSDVLKLLKTTLSSNEVHEGFKSRNNRGLITLTNGGNRASDISRLYSGTSSLLSTSLGTNSGNLHENYGPESFRVMSDGNKFQIYFTPRKKLLTDSTKVGSPRVLTIDKLSGSFDDGTLSSKITCGHGNDVSYNTNTNQLIVTDNDVDNDGSDYINYNENNREKLYYRLGSNYKEACSTGPYLDIKNAYNNISVMNDRFIIPSGKTKDTCQTPPSENEAIKDYCSRYVVSETDPHTGIVMATHTDLGKIIGLTYPSEMTRQTLEYHDGYLYKVYSEDEGSTGVIHVVNMKLKKNGDTATSYGKSVVTYYANFLDSSLQPSNGTRTRMEIQSVGFANNTTNVMHLLFHAHSDSNSKPYIYKMNLDKVTSDDEKYYYGTTVNYFDSNTSSTPNDTEKYYWNELIDTYYYSLGNSHLGWIYSRTGTGATNITETYKKKNSEIKTSLSTTQNGIKENLKTVKLNSTKYPNITTSTSLSVSDNTIQDFLNQLNCLRCQAYVSENDTLKTSGNFISNKNYQLVVKAMDTNSTQILTIELVPTNVIVDVTGVSLNKTSLSIELGNVEVLEAIIMPSNATNKSVTWTSSNPSIATIDSDGKVTALTEGRTTITVATNNNKTATCEVTVTKSTDNIYPTNINILKDSLTMESGNSYKLEASITPNNATNKTITWTSSNPAIATVSSSGLVTAKSFGKTTITATTINGLKDTCIINVNKLFNFTDVPKNSWYYESVKEAYNRGIIAGYSATKFGPNDKVSRGQLVTFLYRIEGEPSTVLYSNPFSDVKIGEYYTDAVKWAAKKKIVNGYGNTGTFGPNKPIIRQDLAVILNNYSKYKGYSYTGTSNLSSFVDYNKVKGGYAEPALKWAVQYNVMSGKTINNKKYIAPFDNTSRAEAAAMLVNFINNFN